MTSDPTEAERDLISLVRAITAIDPAEPLTDRITAVLSAGQTFLGTAATVRVEAEESGPRVTIRISEGASLSDEHRVGLRLVTMQLEQMWAADELQRELHGTRLHQGQLTHVDPLTELANHHGARRRYGEYVNRARFSGQPLSIIVFEVDGLPTIRERWGRPASDKVVRGAASRAWAALRPGDVLARTAPSRFLAILPNASLTAARAAAARITERVEDLRVETPQGHEISLSTCAGVARILQADTTYDDVQVEMDRLIDEARSSGEIAVQTGLSVGKVT